MAEHATKHEVQTCAEHAEITTGKPTLTCNECHSIFVRDNGGWNRYRPEEWVADQIATVGQAYPVGSVFLSVVATDPATLLGYGTWSAIGAGRMLVGQDTGDADFDTLEETGGAKTVTLTEAQIPAHTHVQNAHGHSVTDPGHTHGQSIRNSGTAGTAGTQGASTANNATAGATASGTTGVTIQNTTATNQNTGGGQAHNNMPPYLVVKMWRRDA